MTWWRRKPNEGEEMQRENLPDEAPPAAAPMEPAAPSATAAGDPVDPEQLRESIVETLRTIFDPEIPVNIHEIGLIYGLDIDPGGRVGIRMTLTSPMCPVAESLPKEVEQKVQALPGVSDVVVDVVWDPPWTPQMMSEDARLLLGMG